MVLNWQLARFVAVGAFNTAVGYGLYAAFLRLGLSYPVANFVAVLIGMFVSFATHGHFVFRRFALRRFPLFVLSCLLLWGVNVAVITALLPLTLHNAYGAGALALFIVVPLSFLIQKHVVFGGRAGH